MAGDAGQDAIDGSVGSDAQGVAVGKGITQQRSDPKQNVNTYIGDGGNQWLVAQILDHGQMIRDLTYRLDDIPNQFRLLQTEVQKLKDVEITVRPSEIVITPLRTPDAVVLPMRSLLVVLLVLLAVVVVAVAYLLWEVRNV